MSEEHGWNIEGKTALVTGANTGIGRVTARELAKRGARVFVGARSLAKAGAVVDEIRRATGRADAAEPLALELGSFASVRQAAATFLERDEPLELLVANAGVAGQRGVTSDGFELHFGVNHLGHFLLTALLLERMRASARARVVVVSSSAHYSATGIDFTKLRGRTPTITGLREYSVSKLANVLFTAELARRLGGDTAPITTYSLHPGQVASDAWRRMPWPFRQLYKLKMLSVEQGAEVSLRCATEPELSGISGRYYHRSGERAPAKPAGDQGLAAELWRRSEQWCGVEMP